MSALRKVASLAVITHTSVKHMIYLPMLAADITLLRRRAEFNLLKCWR